MINYASLFEYLKQCPELQQILPIAGEADAGATVILPQGASSATRTQNESIDVNGFYSCEIVPELSLYEDFQINCYRRYDSKDTSESYSNLNVLTYNEVCKICNWIKRQNNLRIFPDIGYSVISIECIPFVPQIRYVNEVDNIVCYFITIRIRYKNDDDVIKIIEL